MSENLPNQSNPEEVDLGQLFNAIGGVFNRFIKFIVSIFKGLFSLIIYALKPIVKNYKAIGIVLFASALLGFIVQKIMPEVYYSEMLVKPYFDSKYELVSNIDYYNALIKSENHKELSSIFEIDTLSSQTLLNFEVYIGPETENEVLKQYDNYIKSIDSIMAQDISYDDFVDNRDIYSSNLFIIHIESNKEDIFKNLEKGLEASFENEYSKKRKSIRDETIDIKKEVYNKGLERIDILQKIYIEVLQEESKNKDAIIGVEGLIPLQQEKTTTKEFELFNQSLRLKDSIRVLDQLKIEESVFFDTVSGFKKTGTKRNEIKDMYSLLFPAITFVLIFIGYITVKLFKFVKEYEE